MRNMTNRVSIMPYVLPHISKQSKEENFNASGPKGWNAQQGFMYTETDG